MYYQGSTLILVSAHLVFCRILITYLYGSVTQRNFTYWRCRSGYQAKLQGIAFNQACSRGSRLPSTDYTILMVFLQRYRSR